MSDSGEPRKNVMIHTRREEIRERYGREPNAFEERALAELPLTESSKLKHLNDNSQSGLRIRELLLDSERNRDVSPLSEVGELLFMRAYFQHAFEEPYAVEEGATEAERARFGKPSQFYGEDMQGNTQRVAMVGGTKIVASGLSHSGGLSSRPSYQDVAHYAIYRDEGATFDTAIVSNPTGTSIPPRNPYSTGRAFSHPAQNPSDNFQSPAPNEPYSQYTQHTCELQHRHAESLYTAVQP